MADIDKQLAMALYEAHAASRQLKYRWSQLSSVEHEHWRRVACAALSWMEDFMPADEPVGPKTGTEW